MINQLTCQHGSWQKLAMLFLALLLLSASGFAVEHGNAQEKARPIDAISDNSFLIEEAYNQEVGVVQHIFTAAYSKNQDQRPKVRGWQFSFTQEWPILSQDHQFSYTIPFSFTHEGSQRRDGIEDVLLNYRYQLLEERESVPAMAPRISLVLPTGSPDRGTGNGVVGLDFTLPISKKLTDRTAVHFNYGISYFPGSRARTDSGVLSPKRSLVSYNLGGSAIWAFSSEIHGLLEWTGSFEESINGNGRPRHDFLTVLSPGVRVAAYNGPDSKQLVLGVATPIGLNRASDNYGVLLYFSFEHGFLSNP
jgi:Putative MetA-pathway of phenol degradation